MAVVVGIRIVVEVEVDHKSHSFVVEHRSHRSFVVELVASHIGYIVAVVVVVGIVVEEPAGIVVELAVGIVAVVAVDGTF